jgi:hypothetical protein
MRRGTICAARAVMTVASSLGRRLSLALVTRVTALTYTMGLTGMEVTEVAHESGPGKNANPAE